MISLGSSLSSKLCAIACDAINQSHDDALAQIAARGIQNPQWETVFVAHLCKSMTHVARGWKSLLANSSSGHRLSMATVFTHQTPYVKWGPASTGKRCELADVLVVIIDRTLVNPRGVATLVQAKLSPTGSVALSSTSEKNQFELLSNRLPFDVDARAAPSKIDLRLLTPDNALMYGLTNPAAGHISNLQPGRHHWVTADDLRRSTGTFSVTGKDCLAYVLIGMLMGGYGWGFVLPPKGGNWQTLDAVNPRDEWSTLVNYLLEETLSKPLSAAHSMSMGRPTRGQEDVMHLTATNALGQPMFFLGLGIQNLLMGGYFSQEADSVSSNWRPSLSNDEALIFDGGDSSNTGGIVDSGGSPENGPISVILFEIETQG